MESTCMRRALTVACGSDAGRFMAVETHGIRPDLRRRAARRGGRRRADLQAHRPRLRPRLPRRRASPSARSGSGCSRDPESILSRRRVRRRAAPLRHRARAEAVAALGAPARHLRPRRRAGGRLRRRCSPASPCSLGLPAGGRVRRGAGLRPVLDGDRPADSRRARRDHRAARAEDLLDPAPPGSRHRAAARHRRGAGAGARKTAARRAGRRSRSRWRRSSASSPSGAICSTRCSASSPTRRRARS